MQIKMKYYGGKWRFANWLLENLPRPFSRFHCFADHFFGSGAVSCAIAAQLSLQIRGGKRMIDVSPGIEIRGSDLDKELVNMLNVIRNREAVQELITLLKEIPFDESTFQICKNINGFLAFIKEFAPSYYLLDSKIINAACEYVQIRMSRNADRKTFSNCYRIRRGMNEGLSKWLSGIEGLPDYGSLLQFCMPIEYRGGLSHAMIIEQLFGTSAFHYFDPPYMHITRGSCLDYRVELAETDEQDIVKHTEISEVAHSLSGKVMVSGYWSSLYESLYKDFRMEHLVTSSAASIAHKKKARVECIWMNY